jgi:SepF-like predicted cell division protein (DUF552 family)
MPFNLFNKKKPQDEEPTVAIQEAPTQPVQETPKEDTAPVEKDLPDPIPKPEAPLVEALADPAEQGNKTYLKAMPLKDLTDVEKVKTEVNNGNIIILRITPLAGKSIEDVKKAVNDLFEFAESIKGDIARLGEERVVICPKTIRIWREKSPAPIKNSEALPPTEA